jgi:hypothetical protein
MDERHIPLADYRFQGSSVAPDAKRGPCGQIQADVCAAGALDLAREGTTGAGDERGGLGFDDGFCDFDSATLDPAGDQGGEHLQHNRRVG